MSFPTHSDMIIFVTCYGKVHFNLLFTDPCCFPLLDTISQRLSSEICFCNVQPIKVNYLSTQAAAHGSGTVSIGFAE